MDVDVEVRVDLRGPQDHHVQAVHHCAALGGAGVVEGGDLLVPGVAAQGLHRLQVEALHVQQGLETPRLEHVYHIAGDAAQAEASLDALFQHDLLEEARRRQGRAPRAGLEGEAVLQKAGALDDLGRIGGHDQAHRVPGDPGGAGDDALGVADGVHRNHIVHVDFRDGPALQGIGHQVVRNDDHFFCVHGVGDGVAQTAAGGLSEFSGAVAHGVRAGGGDEGHVDGGAPAGDVAGPSAVGAELHGLLHEAPGNLPAQSGGHVVRLQGGYHVVPDMVRQGLVDVEEGAGVDGQVLDSQRRDLLHDHVQHVVAVAQVVVEGNRHAVPEPGELHGLPDG